jgi:hypothetical protein
VTVDRRTLTLATLAALVPIRARAATTVTDSAGRLVALPGNVARIMAAGPPASVVVYCLAPEKLRVLQAVLSGRHF